MLYNNLQKQKQKDYERIFKEEQKTKKPRPKYDRLNNKLALKLIKGDL